MRKTATLLVFIALISGMAFAERLTITATDFPCYDFTRQIAGDLADVKLLIKPGTDVHSYEPAPSDIISISECDLFVAIGGESDSWANDILASFGSKAPATIRLIEHVKPLEEEGHEHAYDVEYDEHIWTSPINAILMLRALESAMSGVSPENAQAFAQNANEYISEIELIDAAMREMVSQAVRREIVVGDRFPFLYLANEYGIRYVAAFAGCSTEAEPSASVLRSLIDAIRENDIPVVYAIELSNHKVANVIAAETGAEVLTLNSCQNLSIDDFNAGETYATLMWKNVEALKKGLN